MRPHSNLHSTMYLLNPLYPAMPLLYQIHLHSTMYLLNRSGRMTRRKHILYLHSTMYLLNQSRGQPRNVNPKFTFHYVSIKSKKSVNTIAREVYLHSTMYLLNQQAQMIEC